MNRKMLPMLFAIIIAYPLFAVGAGSANPGPVVHLGENCQMYFNADPKLSVEDISTSTMASRFTAVAGRPIWVGKTVPATWLKFTISLAELGPGYGSAEKSTLPVSQWLLVVMPSFSIILDNVALYVPRVDGGFDEIISGSKTPMSSHELHSRYFAFVLPPGAFAGNPCYIRISSRTDVLVDVDLETLASFSRSEDIASLAYGLIYGILIAMVLYSFFLLISLKDVAYLYYILYTISVGIWLYFLQGHAKLVSGQRPFFDQAMLWFWVGSTITWGALFTLSFLRLRDGRPYFKYVFIVSAALGGVVSISGLAGWDTIAFTLSHYLGILLPILIIMVAVIKLIQGFPSALYFLIAWSFLAVGGFVFSLMGLKILQVNFWTINAIAIGTTIESILLSMALADRFKRLEAEKERLEKIQAHYRELSLTDALTGLHNKRFLTLELNLAVSRARETGTKLSVLLLDIDNFKNVNDIFGHGIGDEILATLARSVRSCTRESDSSCRFGGDELVIIMPGVQRAEAFNVAERIRNRFEAESRRDIDGAELAVTVSLGIAEYSGDESPESLLARADDAMYEAKRLGRNRSVMR
jgi:diguanylate cyclase (GGDEF)-like protein